MRGSTVRVFNPPSTAQSWRPQRCGATSTRRWAFLWATAAVGPEHGWLSLEAMARSSPRFVLSMTEGLQLHDGHAVACAATRCLLCVTRAAECGCRGHMCTLIASCYLCTSHVSQTNGGGQATGTPGRSHGSMRGLLPQGSGSTMQSSSWYGRTLSAPSELGDGGAGVAHSDGVMSPRLVSKVPMNLRSQCPVNPTTRYPPDATSALAFTLDPSPNQQNTGAFVKQKHALLRAIDRTALPCDSSH